MGLQMRMDMQRKVMSSFNCTKKINGVSQPIEDFFKIAIIFSEVYREDKSFIQIKKEINQKLKGC